MIVSCLNASSSLTQTLDTSNNDCMDFHKVTMNHWIKFKKRKGKIMKKMIGLKWSKCRNSFSASNFSYNLLNSQYYSFNLETNSKLILSTYRIVSRNVNPRLPITHLSKRHLYI